MAAPTNTETPDAKPAPKSKMVFEGNPAEDRFNPALRAFNDNTAEARVQRRNALMFAWGCLVLNGILGFGMISASHQPKLIPYIVRIDGHGNAMNMGVPPRLGQDPSLTQFAVQYQLRQFIQGARSVTFDPDFQTKMIDDYVKPFLSSGSAAESLVNDFYKSNNPFDVAKKSQSIQVDVDEPVPQSQLTYELHWYETTKTPQGITIGKTEWKGFATVELHQVTADQVVLNPMGIYLTQLTWQNVGSTTPQNASQGQ